MKLKVESMLSSRGNPVPNQFIIYTDSGTMFQSYSSNIVFKPYRGKIVLGENWNYSRTTSKYRSNFLRETTKVTKSKLDSGEYILDNNL